MNDDEEETELVSNFNLDQLEGVDLGDYED
jgi:hypothetical protein